MKILKLRGVTKDYLWGGNRLREEYFKESDKDLISESWEVSSHKDGLSTIVNGELKGKKFDQYLKDEDYKVIGKDYKKKDFPILIKFIDALKPLSIQVHPSDEYALEHEHDNGKTELWYIMDAKPDSFIYYGFKKEVTKDEFKDAIENGKLEDLLKKEYVKKGDSYLLKAGTVHAIGRGILICEIQQSSNVTYRVYDYMRRDSQGNLRQLHVDKALEVSNLKPVEKDNFDDINYVNDNLKRLAKTEYFDVLEGNFDEDMDMNIKDKSFQALNFLSGQGYIEYGDEKEEFRKGDSFFIPASNGNYKIKGQGQFILTSLGD